MFAFEFQFEFDYELELHWVRTVYVFCSAVALAACIIIITNY